MRSHINQIEFRNRYALHQPNEIEKYTKHTAKKHYSFIYLNVETRKTAKKVVDKNQINDNEKY